MKKALLFLVICHLLFVTSTYALESSPSAKAQQDLLNRVSTIAAQLADKMRKNYSGTIKSLGSTSISLGDLSITTNDATTFYKFRAGKTTEINFKTLKVGEDITAIGTIDPQIKEMTAKQIMSKIKRQVVYGTIGSTEKKLNFDDAVKLQKYENGKIVVAKSTEFTSDKYVVALAYVSDDPSTLSVLKAILISP